MLVSLKNTDNLKTNEIIGQRLKLLISRELQRTDNEGRLIKGKYSSIQDFFDKIQERIDKNCNIEFSDESRKSTQVNNPNTYNKYLNGKNSMKMYVLKQICIELKCSANFLMGITPVNSDYTGSILRLLTDIDDRISYEWDEIDSDIIHIDYYGTSLSYRDIELEEKLKDLINASLFIDCKKK
ncbi:hypothetical protein [Sellimonas sp.]|uniref:hypothetical protein n=1 Tax=Sellimonas sp. TaxID=2021466 RepID=UPI002580D12F|nr:hypothetical protein [Sellimonas sp.]